MREDAGVGAAPTLCPDLCGTLRHVAHCRLPQRWSGKCRIHSSTLYPKGVQVRGIPAVPQGPAVLFLAFQAEGSVGGGEVTAEREPGSRRAGCLAVCTALTCTFSFNPQDVHTRDELRPPLHRAGRGAGKPSRSHEPPSSVSDWKSRIKVYIFLSFSSHQIVISGGPKNV